jgi:copper chaperone
MKFHVPDMSCSHCTAAIEKGITAADAMAQVTNDLSSKTVEVESNLDVATIQKVLEDAGYPAEPV